MGVRFWWDVGRLRTCRRRGFVWKFHFFFFLSKIEEEFYPFLWKAFYSPEAFDWYCEWSYFCCRGAVWETGSTEKSYFQEKYWAQRSCIGRRSRYAWKYFFNCRHSFDVYSLLFLYCKKSSETIRAVSLADFLYRLCQRFTDRCYLYKSFWTIGYRGKAKHKIRVIRFFLL